MPRRANEKDTAAVYELMRGCITPPWTEEQVRAALSSENSDAFVCEADGDVVGYAIAENVLDEGCLTSIAVREDMRGKGLGKRLLFRVINESNAAYIYLEVSEKNAPAIALYKSCGFVKTGERKKYYGDHGALIMRRELSDKTQRS